MEAGSAVVHGAHRFDGALHVTSVQVGYCCVITIVVAVVIDPLLATASLFAV